jgi:hypothetical protein
VKPRNRTGSREEQVRRLITLISAGRDRTIVIRRELPRTKNASSGTRPYRKKSGGFSLPEPLHCRRCCF